MASQPENSNLKEKGGKALSCLKLVFVLAAISNIESHEKASHEIFILPEFFIDCLFGAMCGLIKLSLIGELYMVVNCLEGYAHWKHKLPNVFEKGPVTVKMPIYNPSRKGLRAHTFTNDIKIFSHATC